MSLKGRTMNALELARSIAGTFLQEGQFISAPEGSTVGAAPAAANGRPVFNSLEEGFAGLSVQAVGYNKGHQYGENTVYIYATQGSATQLRKLNKEVHGLSVQVRKLSAVRVRPEQAGAATNRGKLYQRAGRVACGSSCAPGGASYAGTFGALVRSTKTRDLFVLSNNHVIAGCNHVAVGIPIMSPSMIDVHATLPAPVEIGRHAEIVELRSGNPNLVPIAQTDMAIALAVETTVSSWQGDQVYGYDTPTLTADPVSGMRVKKFGRTTDLTTGIIESIIPTPMPLPYKTKEFSATVWFENVWLVAGDDGPFAMAGDSGSLVVTEDGLTAVGLVFATSGNYGVIVPIDTVLAALNLELVGNHGI